MAAQASNDAAQANPFSPSFPTARAAAAIPLGSGGLIDTKAYGKLRSLMGKKSPQPKAPCPVIQAKVPQTNVTARMQQDLLRQARQVEDLEADEGSQPGGLGEKRAAEEADMDVEGQEWSLMRATCSMSRKCEKGKTRSSAKWTSAIRTTTEEAIGKKMLHSAWVVTRRPTGEIKCAGDGPSRGHHWGQEGLCVLHRRC